MLFQSPLFLLFFTVVLLTLSFLSGRQSRHFFLLTASYIFYAAWDVRYLSLIILSTFVDYVVGRKLSQTSEDRSRKILLALSVTTNLTILGVFKYFNFFATNAAALANVFGVELSAVTLSLTLPVGISFYTFQSMSYTIDVYRREIAAERSLTRFALFVGFFPQLVAGPIVRAKDFLPQLANDKRPQVKDLPPGLILFSLGLMQKIVIADHLGQVADRIFAHPELFGTTMLVSGALAYTGQIFCDFAGYSNMAIGIARILGFRLPINFNRPYVATNPREFWLRWHISLSSWLRDYLYISLGGNRRGNLRTFGNLMTTMLLGGLWHGAAWTFVFWGFWHGLLLVIHRLVHTSAKLVRISFFISWPVMFASVLIGWIFFRCQSIGQAWLYLERIVSCTTSMDTIHTGTLVTVFLCLVWVVVEHLPIGCKLARSVEHMNAFGKLLVSGLMIGLAYGLSVGENQAFIYFQF